MWAVQQHHCIPRVTDVCWACGGCVSHQNLVVVLPHCLADLVRLPGLLLFSRVSPAAGSHQGSCSTKNNNGTGVGMERAAGRARGREQRGRPEINRGSTKCNRELSRELGSYGTRINTNKLCVCGTCGATGPSTFQQAAQVTD